MKKEELIIKYMINYLEYFEKNTTDQEISLIFYIIKLRIKEIKKLNKEQLKILNENMKKQLEG